MRIAVFGAAFDPPHLGHLQIAQYIIAENLADEVWWVPVKLHPFGKDLALDADRLAMIELTIAGLPKQSINKSELNTVGKSYTFQTLKAFEADYPQHTFKFVIGSDNLLNFHKWDHYQLLLKQFPFWVYPRDGIGFEPLYTGMTPLPEAPKVDVSSTEIRQKVKQQQSITGLVTPAVEQYIKVHHLYAT